MSKEQAYKIAENFVSQHKKGFKRGRKGVTNKEIKMAVRKVAKALQGLPSSRASA